MKKEYQKPSCKAVSLEESFVTTSGELFSIGGDGYTGQAAEWDLTW